jgi:hypothetical protein
MLKAHHAPGGKSALFHTYLFKELTTQGRLYIANSLLEVKFTVISANGTTCTKGSSNPQACHRTAPFPRPDVELVLSRLASLRACLSQRPDPNSFAA